MQAPYHREVPHQAFEFVEVLEEPVLENHLHLVVEPDQNDDDDGYEAYEGHQQQHQHQHQHQRI